MGCEPAPAKSGALGRARSVHGQLTADGFIVLGGPLGDPEGEAMLVVDAPDEETVQSTLARDPWRESGHLIEPKIQRWTIFLEAEKGK
jgi:uncharacterized protein YciI